MSAPTTHDPLAVNTKDGVCWTRRSVTSSGIALYAPAEVCQCPEFVMATLPELAEHGIAGTADVLPVPVGPAPSERDRLRAAFVEALDNAAKTHPCPVLGDQLWSGCVHYDDAGRVIGVGSCHSERRADAVLDVRDAEMESLRARVAELEAERSEVVAEINRFGLYGSALPVAKALVKRADELVTENASLRSQVAELNESVSSVAEALRARQSCPCPPETPPAPHQVGCFFDGVPVSPPSERPVGGPSPLFPTVASLREVVDGEHYAYVHRSYLKGHDLDVPGTGGAQ